jgi:transposase
VTKYLGAAVDKVRRQEHKALLAQGWEDLKGTKHTWLRNPWKMSARQWRDFKLLRQSTLKTARAWAIREFAMSLWGYVSRGRAEKCWKRWLSWAVRSRLAQVKEVAKTIKEHLWRDS